MTIGVLACGLIEFSTWCPAQQVGSFSLVPKTDRTDWLRGTLLPERHCKDECSPQTSAHPVPVALLLLPGLVLPSDFLSLSGLISSPSLLQASCHVSGILIAVKDWKQLKPSDKGILE